MKKILFCLQTMVLGGVETQLITLLNKFNPKKYDITVCLLYIQDQSMVDKIPDYVKVVNLNINKDYYCGGIFSLIKERIKQKEYFDALSLLFCKFLNIGITSGNVNINTISQIDDCFDYAVCYHLHSPISMRYIIENVKANKKYLWIHNDFKTTGFKVNKYKKWLYKFDKIVGVSKRVTEEFIEKCFALKDNCQTIYNIVNVDEIIDKSKDLSNVEPEFINNIKIKILTVGRFCEQKGFDIAIETAKLLKENNISFSWYAIGYGDYLKYMNELIDKYNLQNEFVILGRKENPYPYMANCDIYVQPSRHEAFGITVSEVKLFKKPIITTNFAGANEQIENNVSGIIVKDFNPLAIYNAIVELINKNELKNNIINNISNLDNDTNWKTIEKLFNE